jgi:hypothetical protein
MTAIITRWDTSQMEPDVEFRMWKALADSFDVRELIFTPILHGLGLPGVDGRIRQVETMEEALEAIDLPRCFLEPEGEHDITDLPAHPFALIVGNTDQHNLALAQPGETYRIDAPGKRPHLYGTNAAAIALNVAQ